MGVNATKGKCISRAVDLQNRQPQKVSAKKWIVINRERGSMAMNKVKLIKNKNENPLMFKGKSHAKGSPSFKYNTRP